MNDTQIKHHIYWIAKQLGAKLDYAQFLETPLDIDICEEVDKLVAYVKENY